MSFMVPLALFGWIPVVLGMFALLPPRRAVIAAFIGAWLFLPMAGYKVSGLPDYDKTFAACVGTFLGTLIFDSGRLMAFRPSWVDLPVLVFCLCPFASCVTNGLGAWAGVSAIVSNSIMWGLPYLIGRVYFNEWSSLRELAIGIFIGGLIYAPLCWYEMRMSPQLHSMVYGFHQHQFIQSRRAGGWRPTVFMQHGLAVAMWMSVTAVLGLWLWRTRNVVRVLHMPAAASAVVLAITAVLCKSSGAMQLVVLGLGTLFAAKWLRRAFPMVLLLSIAPLYMATRTTGVLHAQQLIALQAEVADEDRLSSLETRLTNEDRIISRVWSRPLFGWGWAEFMLNEEGGKDVIPDGLWTLILGRNGFVGLISLTLVVLLPVALFIWRCPAKLWSNSHAVPTVGLAALLCLYMIDCLMNAMINPVFLLMAGGLSSARYGGTAASQNRSRTITQKRLCSSDSVTLHADGARTCTL